MDGTGIGFGLAAIVIVPLWAAFVIKSRGSLRIARAVLWIGAFGPIIYLVGRTADDVTGGGLSALDLARGALPLGALITARLITGRQPSKRVSAIPAMFLTAYLVWASLSTLWSIDPRATALKVIVFVLMWLALWRVVGLYGTQRAALDGIVNVIHVLLLFAIAQYGVTLLAPSINPYGAARLSMFAPAIHPNLLGVIVIAGLMAVLLDVGPPWAKRSGTRAILFFLFMGELVLIDTRSALLFGIVSLLIVYPTLLRRTPLALAAGTLAVAGSAIFIAVRPDVIENAFTRGQDTEQLFTLTGRTDIWDLGWQAFLTSPVIGQGFYAGTRLGLDARYNGWRVSNVDQTWLESLIDVGIIGTVLLAVFVFSSLMMVIFRSMPRADKAFMTSVIVFGIAVSFFNPTLQSPTSTAVVLGAMLLAAALPVDVKRDEVEQSAEAVLLATRR